MALTIFLKGLIIVEIFLLPLLRHHLIKRWHGDIHMSLIDKLRHKTVEQCQKQSRDMCTIHICIGHDHDLVIAKLGNIKIVSVSFGKTTAECIDHGLDLCVSQHFINGGLLYIKDLTADRKNCLIVTVSGCLGRTTGRISLYNKDLTERRILLLTVGKLAIGVEGIFLLGEEVGLGTFLCLTDLGCLLSAGKYSL